jgi:hypothetical protein
MKTKTLDLNTYGVEEMNENEMGENDGGKWCVDINLLIGTYSSCGADHWTWFWEAM